MKQLFLMIVLTSVLFSAMLSWRGDYSKACQEAKRSHKPLLVFVVRPEDRMSQKILRRVFMHHACLAALNRKVVAVMITYESTRNYPVEMYYTTRFPTLFFVDASDEVFMAAPLYGEEITLKRVKQALSL